MKRPIEMWRGLDPTTVAACSPAHIHNLVSDARIDILELSNAINGARHHVNNALASLFLDLDSPAGEGLSSSEKRACLDRARDAMIALAKVAS